MKVEIRTNNKVHEMSDWSAKVAIGILHLKDSGMSREEIKQAIGCTDPLIDSIVYGSVEQGKLKLKDVYKDYDAMSVEEIKEAFERWGTLREENANNLGPIRNKAIADYHKPTISQHRCLTSGMVLHSHITDGQITITIDTPGQTWDEQTAKEIEDRLHDGIEYALAPYWKTQT